MVCQLRFKLYHSFIELVSSVLGGYPQLLESAAFTYACEVSWLGKCMVHGGKQSTAVEQMPKQMAICMITLFKHFTV